MAKKWTNKNLPGALHFVTGNVIDRRPIFKQESYCRAFLEEMQNCRFRNCKIVTFVLMPDHFHYVANPKDGDIQTSTGILKSHTAKRIVEIAPADFFLKGDENQVWQESFKALALWSGWMIKQKINYIHANPVKADLCASAADYRWTSFRAFHGEEKEPLLAIDKNWWWNDDEAKLLASMKQWEAEKVAELMEEIKTNRERNR